MKSDPELEYELMEELFFPRTMEELSEIFTDKNWLQNILLAKIELRYLQVLSYDSVSRDFVELETCHRDKMHEYKFVITKKGLHVHYSV